MPAITVRLLLVICVFAACPSVAATDARQGRLPPGVVPLHYEIRVEPDAAALTFDGRVAIDVEVREATPVIALNAADLAIASAALDGVPAAGVTLDADAQVARIEFAAPVAPGRHRLELVYTGRIYTNPTALFAVDDDTTDGPRRMLTKQDQKHHFHHQARMGNELHHVRLPCLCSFPSHSP